MDETGNVAAVQRTPVSTLHPCKQLMEKAASRCFFMRMKQFTFRTEMAEDNERVSALMEAMGQKIESEKEITDAIIPEYKMGVFTFFSSMELEELRTMMEQLIDNDSNDRFVDMH